MSEAGWVQIVTMIAAMIAGVLAYLDKRASERVKKQVESVELRLNGRLTELLQQTAKANLMLGQQQGVAVAQQEAQKQKEGG